MSDMTTILSCDKCGLDYKASFLPHECAEWTKGRSREAKTMSTSTETRINSELFVKPLPNSTKFLLLNDADWPIAEVYTEAEAEQLASEHNGFQLLAQRLESQASTLARVVGERDRLRQALVEVAIPSLRYCEQKYDHDDQAQLNLEAALEDYNTTTTKQEEG